MLFKNFVPNYGKHCIAATNTSRLMLFREMIAAYCENVAKHECTL
jgi:hypothetical protein